LKCEIAFEKEDEMKKLLVVMLVLTMASLANAQLYISVNGTVDPPDTAITLRPSESVIIDITGDGLQPSPWDGWLLVEPIGGASMSGGVMLYTGSLSAFNHQKQTAGTTMLNVYGGYNTDEAYRIVFADGAVPPAPLNGKLIDGIVFHCDAIGDAKLTLVNVGGYEDEEGNWVYIFTEMDTMIIHQIIPEPMTLGLLGLGGLFLRRRK
jgi:hypothetical protein